MLIRIRCHDKGDGSPQQADRERVGLISPRFPGHPGWALPAVLGVLGGSAQTVFGRERKLMTESFISVIELTAQHGMKKQNTFKVLKRLGIETVKRPGDSKTNRGQAISYISADDAKRFAEEIRSRAANRNAAQENCPDAAITEQGVFYLMQLEPDHDAGRFKVGFATSLPERQRTLKCSAPFIKVVATWPCKNLWEKTAIDCVTQGCERLHTEVFRTESIDGVRQRCDRFFELMPKNKKD
jgi:hypothetical protein